MVLARVLCGVQSTTQQGIDNLRERSFAGLYPSILVVGEESRVQDCHCFAWVLTYPMRVSSS